MGKVSAAERQRLCRLRRKANPIKQEEHLKKDRERWHARKKPIASLCKRDQRVKRRNWRKATTDHRTRAKIAKSVSMPPPATPENQEPSRQFISARKKVRRDQRKCYKDNSALRQRVAHQKKQLQRYRTKLHRLRKTYEGTKMTPRTITKKLLRGNAEKVKKTLTFHHALMEDLRENYSSCTTDTQKQSLIQKVTGKITKRYRLQHMLRNGMGFSARRVKRLIKQNGHPTRKRRSNALCDRVKDCVSAFFNRDDVSQKTPGKKHTITRKKIKVQKRFLVDNIKNLHLKFLAENVEFSLSYASFCRLRPYWVVHRSAAERETCLCKVHENCEMIANKLHQLKVIDSDHIQSLADSLSCDAKSVECMYARCSNCKDSLLKVNGFDPEQPVFHWEWATNVKKIKTRQGVEKHVKVTEKVKIECSLETLVSKFQLLVSKLRKHVFNIRHQYSMYRSLREKLTENDCLLHIDFAENYMCKFHSEIQAVHFGASHQQATLHTGVLYVGGVQEPLCFTTVSDSRNHEPPGIWAYLKPVLDFIRTTYPNVTFLHFFSDGPTSQYRQKGNFYLLSTIPFKNGFSGVSWHLFEAAHGKGAADGVGGALKRSADQLVSQGTDIPDARTMYNVLNRNESKIKLFFVDADDVDKFCQEVPDDLTPIPGTMKIHQITCVKPLNLHYRDISCVCSHPEVNCKCYTPTTFKFHSSTEEVEPHDQGSSVLNLVVSPSDDLIDTWCVVLYEGNLFPGIIQSMDETDIEVKCMHCIGNNKFFWPARDDVLWYGYSNVVAIIPEPTDVTNRYVQVDPVLWQLLKSQH